jgi:hypothetical protein
MMEVILIVTGTVLCPSNVNAARFSRTLRMNWEGGFREDTEESLH